MGSAARGMDRISVEVDPGAALLPLLARGSERALRAPFLTLRL